MIFDLNTGNKKWWKIFRNTQTCKQIQLLRNFSQIYVLIVRVLIWFWRVLTRNILAYSLFWDRIQNSFLFRDTFERWNFSGKWSSCTWTNTKKETKFSLSVFTGRYKKISHWIWIKIITKLSPKDCQLKRKQNLNNVTSFIYKKLLFYFDPTDLVNTKTTIPLRLGSLHSARYIPRRFASQYILPLFTSPLGDSCMLFTDSLPAPPSERRQTCVSYE